MEYTERVPKYVYTSTEVRSARPDVIQQAEQLAIGSVVARFMIFRYKDDAKRIDPANDLYAQVVGMANRITSEVKNYPDGLFVHAEKLPTFSNDGTLGRVGGRLAVHANGIRGIEEAEWGTLQGGLLRVNEGPYVEIPSLEIGPGLYVNGMNDSVFIAEQGYLAIDVDRYSQQMQR